MLGNRRLSTDMIGNIDEGTKTKVASIHQPVIFMDHLLIIRRYVLITQIDWDGRYQRLTCEMLRQTQGAIKHRSFGKHEKLNDRSPQ